MLGLRPGSPKFALNRWTLGSPIYPFRQQYLDGPERIPDWTTGSWVS
jgi:hypothetical protein